jgi:hypothetical protein
MEDDRQECRYRRAAAGHPGGSPGQHLLQLGHL